jgi:sigma-E factor negative regulatory protein RseA
MSDPIREQISAFLDGELPSSETELLLKRLTRDADLRESFGRYALIGEACRGTRGTVLTRDLYVRINRAIDGEPAMVMPQTAAAARTPRWWRPMAGAAVAASVAVVAVVALRQHVAVAPTLASSGAPAVASSAAVAFVPSPVLANVNVVGASLNPGGALNSGAASVNSTEPVSYTTPATLAEAPSAMPAARLTNYVFAHSKYPSLLGQRDVLTDLMVPSEDQTAPVAPAKSP